MSPLGPPPFAAGSGPLPCAVSLAPGARIGQYVVTRFLASGGFGAVYEVRDEVRGGLAAVKVLHPELRALGDPFVRFMREAQVLDLLRHPNVVEIYGSGTLPDGRAYLATELLVGRDLDERIDGAGALSLDETLAILGPVCDALAVAHAAKVVHRDLKASNVFLAERDGRQRVVLLDFGLAKVLEAGGLELTSSRLALGSPASMAPEQLCGGEIDARTDVYGLGALAFHMITGRLPFTATSRAATAHLHLHGARPRGAVDGRIPPAVDAVLGRAMATRPADRHPDARAFLAALIGAASGRDARPATGGVEELGVYVAVQAAEAAGGDPATVLDAVDAALERAEEVMTRHGFTVACESASGILFSTEAAGSEEARQGRTRETLLAAIEAWRAVGHPTGLSVGLAVHRGTDVRRIDRWIPSAPFEAVVATAAAVRGIEVETEPLAGSDRLVRVVPPSALGDLQRASHLDLLATLGARTAGIAHDMRSPITVILGYAEMLRLALTPGTTTSADHVAMVDEILGATQALRDSVDVMMTASATRGHGRGKGRLSVRGVIDRALALIDPRIRARVRVDVADDVFVLGSVGQMVQVITNLVVNAADASGAAGHITIRATSAGAGHVELSVHDDGPGIPAELQQKIFEPFFTTKEAGRGAGLGLALVHDIVAQHGGRIVVASSAGTGTRFTIRLPTVPGARTA